MQFIRAYKKNIILLGKLTVSVLILGFMLLVYPFHAISISERGTIIGSEGAQITLTKDESFSQDITGIGKKLYGIEMVFSRVCLTSQDSFTVRVYEDDRVVFKRIINPSNIIPEEKYYLMTEIPLQPDCIYLVEYTANSMAGELVMKEAIEYRYASVANGFEKVWTWGIGLLALGIIWLTPIVMAHPFVKICVCYLGVILFLMYQFMREMFLPIVRDNKILLLLYAGICFIILLVGAANLYLIYIKKEERVERYFLLNMLSWGMVYMLTFIPYTAPDEIAHVAGANMRANRIMGITETDEMGQAYVRAEDETPPYDRKPDREVIANYYANFADKNIDDSKYVSYTGRIMPDTYFMAYLPQAIGIVVARILHMNNSWLLMIGRLFSLFSYTAIVYLAIRITPRGKWIFYWISQLPIAIELAASYSYDSMSNAWVYLFVAMVLYYALEKTSISLKDQLAILFICLLGMPIKAIYLPLVLLLAVVPKEKFKRGRMEQVIFVCIGIATTVLSVVWINVFSANAFLSSGTQIEEAAVTYTESAISLQQRVEGYYYVIPDFIRNLELCFRVTFHTLIENADDYLARMIGSRLGTYEYWLPNYVVYGFFIILVLIFVLFKEETIVNKRQKQVMWIGALISAVMLEAIFILMSPRQEFVIIGIQGRYFLPMVLVALLSISIRNVKVEKEHLTIPVLGLSGMNLFAILYSFSYIMNK